MMVVRNYRSAVCNVQEILIASSKPLGYLVELYMSVMNNKMFKTQNKQPHLCLFIMSPTLTPSNSLNTDTFLDAV